MSGGTTFGFIYDLRNPAQWHRPWDEVYADALDFAVWSESAGYGGAWVPEHHLASDGYVPSPQVFIAALAARTRTIRLGSCVALAPLHNPVRFAEDCAMLDILSRGRLEISLALGYRRVENEMLGVPFAGRGRMFDEFLEIVTRLWRGETVTFAGEHNRIKGARLSPPTLKGHIPLHIGGFMPRAIERAVNYGDGYTGTIEGAELYIERLEAAGRDPASARIRATAQYFAVAEDPQKGLAELAPYYLHVYNSYADWMAEDQAVGVSDELTFRHVMLDEFTGQGIFQVLTPDAAIAMLKRMQARVPIEHFLLTLPPGIPSAKFRPYAELFAREVIPAFS